MSEAGTARSIRMEGRRQKTELQLLRRRDLGLPRYTLGEEIFSSVSHGVSALFAAGALAVLLVFCEKSPLTVASVSVYGGTMILLYTVSSLYHALGLNRAKVVFRSLDHCTIFLLIAGTYTPITLVCLKGPVGWTLFALVWTAAAAGVVLNAVSVEKFKVPSMICYLAMGWVVVFAMKDVMRNMPAPGVRALAAGGICYTVGAALYGMGKKIPYIHSVFHLFVLAGSVFHTASVFSVVRC